MKPSNIVPFSFRDRSRWISKQPGLTVKFSARQNTQRASRSPPPTQLQSSSVYLTNLPNGVIPSDIINILFPTSIITNLLIHTAPPDQTVSAVVRFKTMSDAQQAISKSGSLVLLSNRIKVREDRAGGNRFSRGLSLPATASTTSAPSISSSTPTTPAIYSSTASTPTIPSTPTPFVVTTGYLHNHSIQFLWMISRVI
ncbi:hypothetical protein BLNAU_11007 [Blattamonas nauphoetae]|uniref:RRM domain-containing protein n=1 Tax=Blattamonas nauphoetae TaxID=2049346 RepID=A0ABQ9XR07_9EUKA|nr:hypothetical protein BLNAU_11007 [Blattamonas nauphoetae]